MVMAFSYLDTVTTLRPSLASEKRSLYNANVGLSDVQQPITSAPIEVRRIIERVLVAEKDKLYMKNPRKKLSIAKVPKPFLDKAFTL